MLTDAMTRLNTDILIIGSGAAGLGLALSLADHYRITIATKNSLFEGSSSHAQGGIAAVLNHSDEDNLTSHVQDTVAAGAGLCNIDAVNHIVRNAKKAIEWLVKQGVQFTTQENGNTYHLTREGGHSRRRIVHVADKTGDAVIHTLSEQVLQHPRITLMEHIMAVDLLCENNRCHGSVFFDQNTRKNIIINAKQTVLATGGASSMYLHTTSEASTSGDGIAMASRAGAQISNMEFNQFHPTSFYHPSSPPFLITEAMRGEGAHLTLPDGTSFLHHYDARKELASRDIVSRAMLEQMQQQGVTHLLLDISHRPAHVIQKHFPSIDAHCSRFNINITQDPIPVVPAAHYTCGGIVTDLQGRTSIDNLYAVGETACTGLHGANRMASNSLLECLVMAMSASQAIQRELPTFQQHVSPLSTWTPSEQPKLTKNLTKQLTQKLQTVMWEHVGILTNNQGLSTAKKMLNTIQQSITPTAQTSLDKPTLELQNLTECAILTVDAAIKRKENRGTHFNTDHAKSKPVTNNS